MATLVSPGVSVTITDESFFIPASAPTVPLFFVATADEKTQPDGVTPASGTFEHDVIRTVTSIGQSTQLYGVPRFLKDTATSKQFHGDARNEYGVFALNQFLGAGNLAYVIRANVNLDDDLLSLRDLWDNRVTEASTTLGNLVQNDINNTNATTGGSPLVQTVDATTLQSLALSATQNLFASSSFSSLESIFYGVIATPSNLNMYVNGYDQPATATFDGFNYESTNYSSGTIIPTEFTPQEAADFLVALADDFKFTLEFFNNSRLGANDAARRVTIYTALQATINSNQDIRSENFNYNLILCPGWPETVDEMLALVADIDDEALVIADTPMDLSPDEITNPSTGWAKSTNRQRSEHVAYYYPSALASNLDGNNVVVAASGVALRTYTFSDNVSFLWFAPAGTTRGIITGVTNLGYVTGTLGGVTAFTEIQLNRGQKNALYQYAPSGDINPLVFQPGRGFLVLGQKTSAPNASAMDRVNVSRLIKYIKRQLRINTMSFLFEPNDQLTRNNLKAMVDAFLGDLVVKRGLYDFATLCDESNNTPDRIDRNELYIDIALKPVKAAEFLYIPIRIVATGAEI